MYYNIINIIRSTLASAVHVEKFPTYNLAVDFGNPSKNATFVFSEFNEFDPRNIGIKKKVSKCFASPGKVCMPIS